MRSRRLKCGCWLNALNEWKKREGPQKGSLGFSQRISLSVLYCALTSCKNNANIFVVGRIGGFVYVEFDMSIMYDMYVRLIIESS